MKLHRHDAPSSSQAFRIHNNNNSNNNNNNNINNNRGGSFSRASTVPRPVQTSSLKAESGCFDVATLLLPAKAKGDSGSSWGVAVVKTVVNTAGTETDTVNTASSSSSTTGSSPRLDHIEGGGGRARSTEATKSTEPTLTNVSSATSRVLSPSEASAAAATGSLTRCNTTSGNSTLSRHLSAAPANTRHLQEANLNVPSKNDRQHYDRHFPSPAEAFSHRHGLTTFSPPTTAVTPSTLVSFDSVSPEEEEIESGSGQTDVSDDDDNYSDSDNENDDCLVVDDTFLCRGTRANAVHASVEPYPAAPRVFQTPAPEEARDEQEKDRRRRLLATEQQQMILQQVEADRATRASNRNNKQSFNMLVLQKSQNTKPEAVEVQPDVIKDVIKVPKRPNRESRTKGRLYERLEDGSLSEKSTNPKQIDITTSQSDATKNVGAPVNSNITDSSGVTPVAHKGKYDTKGKGVGHRRLKKR